MILSKKKTSIEPILTYKDRKAYKKYLTQKQNTPSRPVNRLKASLDKNLPSLKQEKQLKRVKNEEKLLKQNQRQLKLLSSRKYKQEKERYEKRSFSGKKYEGLSKQELTLRKQNYLNTYYNLRKSKLLEITHENKYIYKRINSQKSLYSSKDFDQSYSKNLSLSRRLSQSKLSKISSKKSIQNSKKQSKQRGKQLLPKILNMQKFQTQNIEKSQADKVYRFMSIFCHRMNGREHLVQNRRKKHYDDLNPSTYEKENMKLPFRSPSYKLSCTERLKLRNNLILTRLL